MPAPIMKPEINKNNHEGSADLPIRQAIIIIEHKIRNLEKRKNKLESYQAIQFSGKELSNDQKTAVAKYNEVAQSLELARDFFKQLCQLSSNYEKEMKKQMRKDTMLKAQQETAKIREVLIVQETLNILENDKVWDDFLEGINGAIKLTHQEVDILKKFHSDIKSLQNDSMKNIENQNEHFQKIAECFSMIVDGRSKIYYDDFTFENIKELLDKIFNSGYKRISNKDINEELNTEIKEAVKSIQSLDIDNSTEIQNKDSEAEFKSEAPSATMLPPPFFSNTESSIKNDCTVIPNENEESNEIFASEHIGCQGQTSTHITPISEVISGGNFFFIQDSEIDAPENEQDNIKPEAYNLQENQIRTIQSQTFTNQSMISNGSRSSFQKGSEYFNVIESIEQTPPTNCLEAPTQKIEFPMLRRMKNERKNIVNDSDLNDWKSKYDYESNKWILNAVPKPSNSRQVLRSNLTDRNGNTSRSQMKQNGAKGTNQHYFKSNDEFTQQEISTSQYRSRNMRDRGNSHTSRSQK